jgi:phenylacetic acid degradation operon negative regulatory protein
VRARPALFDLYGDHLRARGGQAQVAALVRLLAALGIAAPAVRTAISRMVRQGWLEPVRLAAGPGYRLTAKGTSRLDEAAARVYRTRSEPWDGHWHVLVITPPDGRTARERMAGGLRFLGYGELDATTWLAPRPAGESGAAVDALLADVDATATAFRATHLGDPASLVRRAWDLAALGQRYAAFVADYAPRTARVTGVSSDEEAFAVRSDLVHTWRNFLFDDPALPEELLPADWAGRKAAEYFDAEAERLLPAASRFIDDCLRVGP